MRAEGAAVAAAAQLGSSNGGRTQCGRRIAGLKLALDCFIQGGMQAYFGHGESAKSMCSETNATNLCVDWSAHLSKPTSTHISNHMFVALVVCAHVCTHVCKH